MSMRPQLRYVNLPYIFDAGSNTVLIDLPDDVKALRNIGIVVLILVGVMMALIVTSVLIG